ncbi:hypothetical protein C5B85_07115 [Pseudoclavibacter sp. AY1F1]|uniref:VanZ family protein n=1 Tax=Pseudoclavibacter sp. AY1F1 TaxID=2080583 RepID=UPI000CE8E48B|nr:VanZ family protein [Pseudoclavibacter sp. AY1F1]PPF45343.1 hypothetical protein C5B85_07115 [Pseudoclavibacter sp. AY1F1]
MNIAFSTALALGSGLLLNFLALVPLIVLSYRRSGGFSRARFFGWAAAGFFFVAIWAYTLFPLPDGAYSCHAPIWNPLDSVADVIRLQGEGSSLLANRAFLQLALNVVLFLPLGFLMRALLGLGVLAATAVGFSLSLLIEVTQLTGAFGVFPCAYRFFDTGDLVTNTTGALLGAIVGLLVMRRVHRGAADRLPGDMVEVPVGMTLGRRLFAMVADLTILGLLLIGAGLVTLVLRGVFDVHVTAPLAWIPPTIVAFLLQAISVYAGGVTLGERAVLIRVREADAVAAGARFARRTARLLFGIGGFMLLGLWQFGPILQFLLGVAALVFAFRSEEHRGLGQWMAGSRPVAVEREERAAQVFVPPQRG